MSQKVKHPAKYTDSLLPLMKQELFGFTKVLDPFGGTGKLKTIRPDAICMDIEPEWGAMSGLQTNALNLPFQAGQFDAVCTSPTYGNRMADHHNAKDGSRRNTYTHVIGHQLHDHNSGKMQWGQQYKAFHLAAWNEVTRVMRPSGKLVLNIKNHIRKGEVVGVVGWHIECLSFDFQLIRKHLVETPSNKFGQNGDKRVSHEHILVFIKRSNP